MAIEDRDRYYALDGDKDLDGSEANYETAENIDAVLRDMTDIYQNTPAADIGKAVVLDEVETEDEQTIRRFRLKEVSKAINAQLKEIIVGNGNNWAMGNGYTYKIDYIWTDASTVTTGGPSNFAIAHYVQTMPSTFGVMTEAMNPNNQPFNPPRYVLKSGFTTRDTAKQKIAGTAQVNIGDDNQSYSTETFWGRAVSGPEVNIGSAAIIEMNSGGYQPGFIPVLSMRGNCVIDMKGKLAPDSYYNWAEHNTRTKIKNAAMPFTTNKAAPIFQMHDEAIVSIVEKATLQMKNAAMVEIGGNADVHIYGGDLSNDYHVTDDKIDYKNATTDIYVGPESHIRTNNIGLQLTPTQAYMGIMEAGRNLGKQGLDGTFMTSKLFSDTGSYGSCRGDCAPEYKSRNSSSGTSNIFEMEGFPEESSGLKSMKPTIGNRGANGILTALEGNINAHYSANGYFAKRVGVEGTYVADLWTSGNVNIERDFVGGNHVIVCNMMGDQYIQYSPYANVQIQATPHGDVGIKFDPKNVFGIDYDANHLEYLNHAEKIISICNGKDHFKQIGGSSHIESWSGNVILRNRNSIHNNEVYSNRPHAMAYSNSGYYNDSFPDYPYIATPNKTKTVQGGIQVDDDLSSMSISDIETTYKNQLLAAMPLSGDPDNRIYSWSSFSGTSKEEKYRKYGETLVVQHFNINDAYATSYFYSNNEYDVTTLAQSAEFKAFILNELHLTDNGSTTIEYSTGSMNRYSGGSTATYQYYVSNYRVNIKNVDITMVKESTSETYVYRDGLGISSYYSSDSGTIYGDYSRGYGVLPGYINSAINNKGSAVVYNGSSPYCSWNWSSQKYYGYTEDLKFTGAKIKCNYSVGVKVQTTSTSLSVAQLFARTDTQNWFKNSFSYVASGAPHPNGATYDSDTTITSTSRSGSYTYYYVKNYILTYDETDYINKLYTTSSSVPASEIDYPNTTYANLPEEMQTKLTTKVKNLCSLSNSYKTVITTDLATTTYTKVKNWLYSITTKTLYSAPTQHRGIDWMGPVQTKDAIGEYDWENGPIVQAYGPSNFMMRAKYQLSQSIYYIDTATDNEFDTSDQEQAIEDFKNSSYYAAFLNSISSSKALADIYSIHQYYYYGETKFRRYYVYYGLYDVYQITTTADEFDLTDMNAAIRQFIASSYLTDLETYIAGNFTGKELWYIGNLTKVDSTTYKVNFALKDVDWNPRVESYEDTPVIEVVDGSELRMYGGAYVKGETVYGETTFTFGSTNSDETPVSFTLAELAALKNMLINPPQSFVPLTQAQYDLLDPPDPDTLYVITDGATAAMLPDASVAEF